MSNIETSSTYFPFEKRVFSPQEQLQKIETKKKSLLIGIPKEGNHTEYRIPLTPQAVALLTEQGHKIIVESNAGMGANYTDKDYSLSGAFIASQKADVYKADIILKVAPLASADINMLRERQLILSSLNMQTQNRNNIKRLMQKKVTALAFEYIRDEYNTAPIVKLMSEIAGTSAIMTASEYLSVNNGGKGILLGGITGIRPTNVMILGADTAGEYAARTAINMGALVNVFDASLQRLRQLQNNIGQRIFTSVFQEKVLKQLLKTADVVICSVSNYKKGKYIITEDMVKSMKLNSIIIDLGIDQGSTIETSETTTLKNPVFKKHGVIHYCVPNIPSGVARTASIALSNVLVPTIINIGESGNIQNLFLKNTGLRKGIYIYNGILTNKDIGEKFDIDAKDIDLLMVAF